MRPGRELVLTTPYFVPDESLFMALTSAARRGVTVSIIVPDRVDSPADGPPGQPGPSGRPCPGWRAGDVVSRRLAAHQVDNHRRRVQSVRFVEFRPRSRHLNFEITLAVYDAEFTACLRQLQQGYMDQSAPMDLVAWQSALGHCPVRRKCRSAARPTAVVMDFSVSAILLGRQLCGCWGTVGTAAPNLQVRQYNCCTNG